MMAQEVDVEFSDAPTSNGSEDENGGFIPLEEFDPLPAIEPDSEVHFRDPKKVEKLVSKLQEVIQKAVYSNHKEPIEIASAELKKWGEKLLDFDGFDEAKKDYSPLMRACEEGKTQIVKVLLEQGASVAYKGKNPSGISPVHIACSKGYSDILKLLLTYASKQRTLESSLNSKSAKENWTPLMYAVKSGHLEIVKLLLHDEQLQSIETGTVHLEACTKKKENVLHLAAHCQQLDCLKELHSKLSTLDPSSLCLAQDKKGWNVLHYACAGGSVEVVRWLLKSISELKTAEALNQASENNYTPLLVACEYQKREVVRYLLREDQGAQDMGVKDLGVDATARAVERDPKSKKIIGHNKTGLHMAAIHDSPEIAEEFIAKGCPLDAQDYRGDTALHIAHRKASLDVADILRRAPGGEELTGMKNKQNKTPDQIRPEDVIPPEIKKRGPKAEEAYRKALRKGKKKILRCGLQILGEQLVGKTSLLRLLTGKEFIENLDRTHGIDNQQVDTVDIRPISMAASPAWKEVKPEDQAQQDDDLLVDGMVEELAKAGISLNPKKEDGKQKMLRSFTTEDLLGMIDDALKDFKQPPKSLEPHRAPLPFYRPHGYFPSPTFPQPPPRDHWPTYQSVPTATMPPRPLPTQPVRVPPPFISKPQEKPKHIEPLKPKLLREVPSSPQPSASSHQKAVAPPTDSRKQISEERPNALIKVSRRIHRSVSQRMKAATPAQIEPVLHLNTYDFAGQDMYRPMHHCFITRRALYLVVFNLQSMMNYLEKATGDKPLEEIRYWLNSIHAHIHITSEEETTKRVLLVGTHKAPKNGRKLNEDQLKQIHTELEKVFYKGERIVNHLCFIGVGREKQIFAAVENSLDKEEERQTSGITTLQSELTKISKDLPFLKEQYPILWLRFERGLLQLREQYNHRSNTLLPLIKLEEVQRVSHAYGIEPQDADYALRFFHDTGTIVCLKELSSLFLSEEEKKQLDSLVLLDPEKLMKVMSNVMELRNCKGDQRYLGEDIREVNKGVASVSLLKKCWKGCYSQSADHGCSFEQLCLILQAYSLIYPLPIVPPPSRSRSEPVPPSRSAEQMPLQSKSSGDTKLPSNTKFLVPCMLPKITDVSGDKIPKITFYFDFYGFLLAEFFHRFICLMLKKSTPQSRGRKRDPEFSATRCKFPNVNGRKWEVELEGHRLKISVIPRHDEKESTKPSSYILLIHREFLQEILCDNSNLKLQGLTYHGGPLLEKCVTPECSWRGVLPFISYPELEETDCSPKVTCEGDCNHEYNIDCLLQVTQPKNQSSSSADRPPNVALNKAPSLIYNIHTPHAIVATGDRTTIQTPHGEALVLQSQGATALTSASHVESKIPAVGLVQPPCTPHLEQSATNSFPAEKLLNDNDDHYDITECLRPIKHEKEQQLIELGKQLGLHYPRLKELRESHNFLDELVLSWLRKEDSVNKRCPPTWANLARALTRIGQNGIAQTIRDHHCR